MNQKKWIGMVLIVTGLVGAVFLVWQRRDTPQSEQTVQKVEQLVKTDELENVRDLIDGEYAFTPIDTSDWKTYRNEKQGYEVQYPTSWTMKDYQENGITLNSEENEELLKKIQLGKMYGEGYMSDINIVYYESVSEEPENILNELNARTIDEFVERNYIITKIEKMKFSEETAWVVIWGGFGAYLTILVEHNNHLYKIMFGNKEKISDLSVTDYEILRSFSFLK